MQTEPLYLGIDGGGSKTAFLLWRESDGVVRSLTLGASNPHTVGIQNTVELLKEGIVAVCEGMDPSGIFTFAGIAGCTTEEYRNAVLEALEQLGFAGCDCGSDSLSVLQAGLGDSDGLSLIMGTGFAIFRRYNGNVDRIGGWGVRFDAHGSGYCIGRDALLACLNEYDGTGSQTMLSGMITFPNGKNIADNLRLLYEYDNKAIASYAIYVFQAAQKGDQVAVGILQTNARFVAEKLKSAARTILEKQGVVKVVMGGSVAQNPMMIKLLKESLGDPDHYLLEPLTLAPVYGAVQLAVALRKQKGEESQC